MLSFFSRRGDKIASAKWAAAAAFALCAVSAQAQQAAQYQYGAAPSPMAVGEPLPGAALPTNPPGAGDESGPKTRAQVKAELARLRQAGYDPNQWWNYPENLQEAQKRVQIESAGGVYTPPSMPIRHSSGL